MWLWTTFESEPEEVARAFPGALGSVPLSASIPASASRSPRAAAQTYKKQNVFTKDCEWINLSKQNIGWQSKSMCYDVVLKLLVK